MTLILNKITENNIVEIYAIAYSNTLADSLKQNNDYEKTN